MTQDLSPPSEPVAPSHKTPVLYSFRRCPYAMRARLAIASADIAVQLREIVLRDKAPEFLKTSPSGTVPCLQAGSLVIDESLDIMFWALNQNDPEALLIMPPEATPLIHKFDGPFKSALDRYKYSTRYDNCDRAHERSIASGHLQGLEDMLEGKAWLFGDRTTLVDLAILPFIRQFAFTDKVWFDAQPWPNLHAWLEAFITSPRFLSIMAKYPKWEAGDPITAFP